MIHQIHALLLRSPMPMALLLTQLVFMPFSLAAKTVAFKGWGVDNLPCRVKIVHDQGRLKSVDLRGAIRHYEYDPDKGLIVFAAKSSIIPGGGNAAVDIFRANPKLYSAFQYHDGLPAREAFTLNSYSDEVPGLVSQMQGTKLEQQISFDYIGRNVAKVRAEKEISVLGVVLESIYYECEVFPGSLEAWSEPPVTPVTPSRWNPPVPEKAPRPQVPPPTSSKPGQKPPVSQPSKPAPAPSASCANNFMAKVLSKNDYTCDISGSYSGFPINQSGVKVTFKHTPGARWQSGGISGRTAKYSAVLGPYEVDLFQVNLPPTNSQTGSEKMKSVENCSASSMKATNSKSSGGSWTITSNTEIKRTGARALTMSATGPSMQIRLNCK